MVPALLFLRLLLPESPFAIIAAKSGGHKRNVWKRTLLESMEQFIDVQEVLAVTVLPQ